MSHQDIPSAPPGENLSSGRAPFRFSLRNARGGLARIGATLLFCLLSFGGAALGVGTLGRCAYRWHGFEVELRLVPAWRGETRLVLAPLGEVHAPTHAAPVALVASLQEIRIEEIKKLVANGAKREDLARDFERVARADLRAFILRQEAVAALGALLAPLLFRCRRLRLYFGGSLLGALVLSIFLANALTTFNGNAFRSPTYTGTLRQAPWVIQFGKDTFNKFEAFSQKLRRVATNLNVLYGRIAALNPVEDNAPNTFRVLHVSDIHNNVAALDFLRQVADQFKVSFIVDTGDLTDFGSPPETVLVEGIGKLPYPYVFVLGNHDSQAIGKALARQPNVLVLDGQVVTVEGLSLLGLPNPAAARAGIGSVDTMPEELAAGGAELLRLVQAMPVPPDIVAIHDPEEARPLYGRVPLILCGHEHRIYVEEQRAPPGGVTPFARTVVCNAGTTGAAGLRYFEKEKGVPFSCAVLTFRRAPTPVAPGVAVPPVSTVPSAPNNAANANPTNETSPGTPLLTGVTGSPVSETTVSAAPRRPQLIAIDRIVLNGSLGEYSISHQLFSAETPNRSNPLP